MGAWAPSPGIGVFLAASLLLASAAAQVEVASDKTGTIPQDVIGLQRLYTAWGEPKALKNWISPDPCAISNPDFAQPVPAAGIICDTLEQPVLTANGANAWLYVKEIRLSSRNPLNFDFNLEGEIAPAAFAAGRLRRLEILDVSFNKVTGIIPTEVSYLTNLTRLALNNNQLNGTIPSEIGLLTNLDILWLGHNQLTGSIPGSLAALAPNLKSIKLERNNLAQEIPTFLATATNLVEINLASNGFTGNLPPQFSALTRLTSLYLQNNGLTGTIPSSYSNMKSLKILMLSNNQLSGPIPTSLATIPRLQNLGLASNHMTGTVPIELSQMPYLGTLSLQWNNFTGTVGPSFQRYPQGFLFNPTLCVDLDGSGYQSCSCTMGKEGQRMCQPTGPPSPCVCPDGTLPEEEEGGLAVGWIVMITLLGAAALVVLASLVWWGYRSGFGRRKTGGGWEYAGKIRSFPDVRTYRSQAYDPDEIDGYGITAYDPTPSTAHSRNSSMGFESGSGMPGGQSAGSPGSNSSTAAAFARKFGRSLNSQLTMRQFSYDELQLATNNFSNDNVVSTDGTLKTYSGVLPSGTYVAVKELEGAPGESMEAFAAAVEVFSLVRCPQLVEVLGFACGQAGSRFLVYELMPNGSLDLHLHELDGSSPPLDWNTRMTIALQVAKALGYLHSMSPQMVHQHLQASTVLLDDHYSPKLSDYCLDSLRLHQGSGPHAASTNVAVAAGTAAPELAWSSQPTPRTDVYAFGVLLLEIITGRRPIDSSRPPTEQSLVRWTKPRLSERAQVEAMVDPNLRGSYSTSSLYQVALLASQCISTDPESRPSMAQAIDVLQNVQGLPLS